jgi:hypothetical protein
MMRSWLHGAALCAILAAVSFAAPARAQDQAAPPLVEQINNGNWLARSEAESLVDDLYYHQAIQSYLLTLPILNTIGMRDGSEAAFGAGYNVLPVWMERMDSRTWVPTPNADVVYSMSYLDLKKDGPLVVAAPPNVIGMFTDFYQRTITDVGAIGPDRARGGLYLLLPARLREGGSEGLFRLRVEDLQCVPLLPHADEEGRERPRSGARRRVRPADPRLSPLGDGERREADGLSRRERQARQHDVSGRQQLLDKAQVLCRL